MNVNPEMAQIEQPSGKVRRKGALARSVFLALAGLFLFGIVLQVFLAGVALMDDSSYLDMHKGIGYLVIFLTIPMLFAALAGRVSPRTRAMAIAAVVLGVLQYLLIAIGNNDGLHIVRALHPVNALILFGLSFGLLRAALAERAADHQSPEGRSGTVGPSMEAARR